MGIIVHFNGTQYNWQTSSAGQADDVSPRIKRFYDVSPHMTRFLLVIWIMVLHRILNYENHLYVGICKNIFLARIRVMREPWCL